MENNGDVILIEQTIKGDEAAFNELYEKYVRLVYYIAYKNTLSDADAKDIVQETFIEVKRTIHTLQNPSAFKFWLNRIVLSKCKNLFRKNHYVNVDYEQTGIEYSNFEEREYLLPQENARKNSDCMVLNQLINELPQGQREVLILYYLEEFRIDEIALLLDIPAGTVKSRLSYARDALKQKIERYEKKENIKLNFHTLGSGISLALSYELSNIQGIVNIKLIPHKSSNIQTVFMTHTLVKVIAFCMVTFLTLGGGIFAYQHFHDVKDQENKDRTVLFDDEEEREIFPLIHVKDKDITTSESAYFNLKLWLCCEKEMEGLSKAEFIEIKPLYEQLKQLNNTYYHSLKDSGWADSFELLYPKFE